MVGDRTAPTNDLAVFGFCELWGLAFGFPPVEELYHGAPVSGRMVTFMAIGGAFAALGPTWPLIKARFPRRWSVSFVRTASDFRAWLAALIAVFVFMYGPEFYNRIHQEPAGQSAAVIHEPATDEQIEKAAGVKLDALRQSLIQTKGELENKLATVTKERDALKDAADAAIKQRNDASRQASNIKTALDQYMNECEADKRTLTNQYNEMKVNNQGLTAELRACKRGSQ